MRYALIAAPITALLLLCSVATPATAQVSVSIGFNLPGFPVLQRVPGYPVYYAPRLSSNYFFYDGLYWVYEGDNWFASPWYNGPWEGVDRFDVPLYVLRVPVRYYRSAPVYFRDWRADAPPRWGDHWGASWEQRRSGWDRWNRSSAPAPAPLPTYQRQYSGSRYPAPAQQAVIQTRSYTYKPREVVVQQRFQQQRALAPAAAPAPQPREAPRRAAPQQPQSQPQQPQSQPQRQQQKEQQQPAAQGRPQHAQPQPAPKAAVQPAPKAPAQRAPTAREQPVAQPLGKAQPQSKPQERAAPPAKAQPQSQPQERAAPPAKAKGREKDDKDKEERGKGRDR